MSIRFYCHECRQLLKARNDKVGKQMPCPKCRAEVTVPAETDAEITRLRREKQTAEAADPFADLVVYDEGIVYETEDEQDRPEPTGPTDFDRNLVAISRRVLYGHAAALAVLAVAGFVAGYIVGHSGRRQAAPVVEEPRRVMIDGRLQWEATTGLLADKGAVVIALPESYQPETKLPGEVLGPDKPMPNKGDQLVQTIEQWGGEYARTNDAGEFELFLLPGEYHLLIISHQSERLSSDQPSRDHLAAVGAYFTSPHDLIGPYKYHWVTQQLDADSRVMHDFLADDGS